MNRVGPRLLVTALGLTAALAACTTDYQKGLEDPRFGAPNALANQKQPGPSSDTAIGAGGAPAGGATPECVRAGGTLVPAGAACAVSFKTDVLGAFSAGGCALVGCHGGATPANQPRIDAADGPGTWNEFGAFKLSNGKLYINPCSTDPNQSSIAANSNKDAPAADRGTLMPPGVVGLPADVLAKIKTWQECGAPNN
jgi:hypothetical protein